MTIAYDEMGSARALFFLPPVYLHCTEFLGRNLHAENDAEGGDYIRFTLQTRARGTDGKKVVGVGSILCGAKEMIGTSRRKRLRRGVVQGDKEDVEKSVPVTRRGNIPLTGTDDGFKTPEVRRRGGYRKGTSATTAESFPRQGGPHNGVTPNVIRDEEGCDVGRDPQSTPRESQ